MRWRVRSTNWSGMTKSSGRCSSFSEPTADSEMIAFDAKLLQSVNVGAVIQLGRHEAVSATMAGQKGNAATGQRAQYVGIGRRAKWRLQRYLAHFGQARAWSTSHCRR